MKKYELIKFADCDVELDVKVSPEENTVWLSQKEMAQLFEVSSDNIGLHISNILKEGELEQSTTEKSSVVQTEGGRRVRRTINLYNLDMIISVGYRVKSKRGITFRRWANSVLKQYLIKGYAVDGNRSLVTIENFNELVEKVDSIDKELQEIKNDIEYPIKEKLIIDSQVFDAIYYLEKLVSSAKKYVVLVDAYADIKALNIIKNAIETIPVKIITSDKAKISGNDIDAFKKQYRDIEKIIDNSFHDRFLFIDNEIYHLGTSINFVGRKISLMNRIEDEDIKEYLIKRIGL